MMPRTEKKYFSRLACMTSLLLVIAACASPMKKIQVSHKFADENKLSSLRVAILPLEGKQNGREFFREALHANLMNSDFKIVEKFVVDGIINQNMWQNPEDLLAIPPQKLGEALGVDALLYGKVTKWNKYYAIIHSTLVVGLDLKLVDVRTGELLWAGEHIDREFEGLLKIPTGIISAAISPLIFVGEKGNLHRLANQVAGNITESLVNRYNISEEDKMESKVVVASAESYIKEIENNDNMFVQKDGEGLSPAVSSDAEYIFENPDSKIKEASSIIASTSGIEKTLSVSTSSFAKEQPLQIPPLQRGGRGDSTDSKNRVVKQGNHLSDHEQKLTSEIILTGKLENTSEEVKLISSKTMNRDGNKFEKPLSGVHSKNEDKKYTVQVGAFQSQNYAEILIRKLKEKGYDSFVALSKIGKKLWYKVQINRFEGRKEAIRFAQKLQKKEKLPYFITKTEVYSPT